MQGQARIALEVVKLARARHHPEEDLSIRELHLDATDPRRSIFAQRRQRLVFADVETLLHAARESRLGRRDSAQLAITRSRTTGAASGKGSGRSKSSGH